MVINYNGKNGSTFTPNLFEFDGVHGFNHNTHACVYDAFKRQGQKG